MALDCRLVALVVMLQLAFVRRQTSEMTDAMFKFMNMIGCDIRSMRLD